MLIVIRALTIVGMTCFQPISNKNSHFWKHNFPLFFKKYLTLIDELYKITTLYDGRLH